MTNRFKLRGLSELSPQVFLSCPLEPVSSYTPALLKAAHGLLEQLYQPGVGYKKLGVMLLDLVPSQERLTRLKNMKVLPPGDRRRIESTAGYVLEQVGQPRPGDRAGFELGIEDLFMGVNVQRPATRAYLREALAEHEDFLIEDDTFIYFPPPEESASFDEGETEDE